MKKQLFIILIIILFGNNFQTSAARLLYKSKSDTNYYESHKKMLAIKFLGVSKVASFSIFDNQNSSKLLYQPNEALNIGLGFNYKWFGLDLAFNIPGFNNDNAKYLGAVIGLSIGYIVKYFLDKKFVFINKDN